MGIEVMTRLTSVLYKIFRILRSVSSSGACASSTASVFCCTRILMSRTCHKGGREWGGRERVGEEGKGMEREKLGCTSEGAIRRSACARWRESRRHICTRCAAHGRRTRYTTPHAPSRNKSPASSPAPPTARPARAPASLARLAAVVRVRGRREGIAANGTLCGGVRGGGYPFQCPVNVRRKEERDRLVDLVRLEDVLHDLVVGDVLVGAARAALLHSSSLSHARSSVREAPAIEVGAREGGRESRRKRHGRSVQAPSIAAAIPTFAVLSSGLRPDDSQTRSALYLEGWLDNVERDWPAALKTRRSAPARHSRSFQFSKSGQLDALGESPQLKAFSPSPARGPGAGPPMLPIEPACFWWRQDHSAKISVPRRSNASGISKEAAGSMAQLWA
ncbi:hypothetical protein FB451DRAFT_1178502 [Mycena latifolia]|nr:hypothetical protein FB451DRAFT_1178502 [Mycena latifolia]